MLVAGAIISVNTTNDGTPNASDGKCMLREAIASAALNTPSGSAPGECAAGSSSAIDTIVFDPTVFDTSGMHTITIQGLTPNLPGSVTIQGPGSNFLTIDGNNFRIFYASSTNGPVVISGMTLTHGKSSSGLSSTTGVDAQNGGAILNFSDLTLTDVAMIANSGGDGGTGSIERGGDGGKGGAIYNFGTVTMTDCVLTGNRGGKGGDGGNGGNKSPGVGGSGGAIYNEGTLTMTNCMVSGNTGGMGGDGLTSTGGDGGSGGGIYSDHGSVTLTNVTISNNSGGHSGTVTNPDGNFGGHGGGLYTRTGVVQLIDSTVSGNSAGLNGPTASGYAGGIENGGSMTIVRSTISGNTAYNSAGGILNRFSLTMLNSTVSGNRILSNGSGTAINTDGSTTLVLTNCTISGNSSASGSGGAVASFTSPGPTVKNTIIAANSSGPDVVGNFNSQGYNLIGYPDSGPFGNPGFVNGMNGDKVGTSGAPLDPKLGPLANNGGPTQTHALLVGSPALDAGADTFATDAGLTTDQRGPGFPRISDGPDADTTATVDIGAFEFQLSIEDITDKATNEDTPLTFNFNIGDYTDGSSTVTVTSGNQALVPDANLIVTGTGQTRTLQITPVANQSGTATISVQVNAVSCQVCADTFVLTVNAVNDAPTLDAIGNLNIQEDAATQTVNLSGITAGGGESQALTITATSSNTALIPNPTVTYASPASAGSISFTPVANATGAALITVTVTDNGGTANGGINSFSRSFTVAVNAVNDAPVANVPVAQSVPQNTDLQFSLPMNNRIFVLDADAGSNPIQVTLGVTNGTLTLTGTAGLSFSVGDGSSDTTMTFTGTITSINAALHGMAFAPTQGFSGSAVLTIEVNDLGNTGVGGALTDSKSVNINVNSGGTLQFNASTYTSPENNAIATITVTRTGGSAGLTTVSYATSDGTATAGTDYLATSGTLSFDPGVTTRTFGVQIINDSTSEPDETINLTLSNVQGSGDPGTPATAVLTITNDDAPRMQFSQANYSVSETSAFLNISVTRTGDISTPSTVKYATSDSTDVNFNCNPNTPGQATIFASRKCDYHIAAGTLRFAAGETSKQFSLSIVNDVYFEAAETLNITLSSPVGGTLGQNTVVPVTITDTNETGGVNPIDNTSFFVRQLYVDLLSREPDPAGWDGWITRIDKCGQPGQPPPPCDRVTVAGDGFLRSGEFFDRQFFVIRLYRTGLGRILRYDEVSDLAFVSGFLTAEQLELNKQDLVAEIMSRPEFSNRYGGLTSAAFVDALLQTAGVTVPQSDRDQWVTDLNTNNKTRARVYREISERAEVSAKYLHEAQVVSAYYGFFSRNPDGAYLSYLQRLDSGEITLSDLANAFVNAAEYRQRFGQ
jgi:hypothetical protein